MYSLNRRSIWTIAAAVSASILMILVTYVLVFSTVTVEGVVDHKTIVGISEGVQYTLVTLTAMNMDFTDPAVAAIFENSDANRTVTQAMEQELIGLGYGEIKYLASIRVTTEDPVNHLEPGDTLAYFVKRTDFNSLSIGEHMSFEVAKMTSATIREIHE